MKIYILSTTEEGATCIYSKNNNKVGVLDVWKKYSRYTDNDDFIDGWDALYFYFNSEINKNKIKQDIMHFNFDYFISDDKTKGMLESAFGEYIQFLDAVNEEDLSAKYYMFYPVRSLDALDIDRSECRFLDEEKRYFAAIYNYVFKSDVEYYPVFKLRRENVIDSSTIYATDEFKNYIEENNITGFNFVEVYDSETYNSNKETEEATKTSAEEITTFNGGKCTIEKQMIPMTHEDGVFAAGVLEQSSDESLTIEHFGSMLTNSANSYTVYDIDDCDIAKDIEVTYRGGRLGSVYMSSGKTRIPIFMRFDFSPEGESAELTKAVSECVELCGDDLLKELKNARTPLEPLSFEYYYDGEQMNMNLQDRSCNIYSIGNTASHLLRCICSCAGEQCPGSDDPGFEIFGRILEGLHKKLSEDIPKRFEVTDDFKLSEPEMID